MNLEFHYPSGAPVSYMDMDLDVFRELNGIEGATPTAVGIFDAVSDGLPITVDHNGRVSIVPTKGIRSVDIDCEE